MLLSDRAESDLGSDFQGNHILAEEMLKRRQDGVIMPDMGRNRLLSQDQGVELK